MWTGHAIKMFVGPPIDLTRGGVSAMPDNLFSSPLVDFARDYLNQMMASSWNQFSSSIVKKFHVTQIPCKPSVSRHTDSKLHQILKESRDGVDNFMPIEMNSENVGSNRGLLKLIKGFDEERKKRMRNGAPDIFEIYSVDCNIFSRMIKVCFFLLIHFINIKCFSFYLTLPELANRVDNG